MNVNPTLTSFTSLDDLLGELELRDPEPWMPTYFEFASQLIELESQKFPNDTRIEFEAYVARARHIRILEKCGQHEAANKRWSQLEIILDGMEFETVPKQRKRELIEELNLLEPLGFRWDEHPAAK